MGFDNKIQVQDKIYDQALKMVIFDGWHDNLCLEAGNKLNIPEAIIMIAYPNNTRSLLDLYYTKINENMRKKIEENASFNSYKVREKIYHLIATKIDILSKDVTRKLLSYLMMPNNITYGTKKLYETVDIMWYMAGDKSTDFNYYTKRLLLAQLYKSTILYWLNDDSLDYKATHDFILRRIETILKIGRIKPFFDLPKRLKVLLNIKSR